MAQSRFLTRKSSMKWAAGTVGTPTSAASYPVANVSRMNLEDAEYLEGRPLVGQFIRGVPRIGQRYAGMEFTSELYGQSGNTVPWYGGALLRACGMKEAVSATNFFAYTGDPTANPHLYADDTSNYHLDPIDLVYNCDGLENYAEQCVGSFGVRWAFGQIPVVNFSFVGLPKTGTSLTASALAQTAQTAYATEVQAISSRGATSTVGGATVVLLEAEYNKNNIIDERGDINGEFGRSGPIVTGADPTWRVLFEVPPLSTLNPTTLGLAGTNVAISIAHNAGGTALHVITTTWTGRIGATPTISDVNGKAVYEVTGVQSPSTGALTMTWS